MLTDHGKPSRYNQGCRCNPCKAAHAKARCLWIERSIAMSLEEYGPKISNRCIGIDGICPHGTKLYKTARCNHCQKCRMKMATDKVVDTKAVIRHLKRLKRASVSLSQVGRVTGIHRRRLEAIMDGSARVRNSTADVLLSVTKYDAADGALVDSAPILRLIDDLMKNHGFTKRRISEDLGYTCGGLNFKKRITVRNAERVRFLHSDAVSEPIGR